MALPSTGEVIALLKLLPQCTWRPLRFGNDGVLSVEGQACSQMTVSILATVMMSWGKTLSWQSPAMGSPLADLSATLSSRLSLLLGWDRAGSLSTREVLQWVCRPTQAKPMLRLGGSLRLLKQMHEGRALRSNENTKLSNIYHL